MPEQTLIDHMLAELARRQDEYAGLKRETEQAQAAEIVAQDRRQAAVEASGRSFAEVRKMQAALSALGYVPGQTETQQEDQGATE